MTLPSPDFLDLQAALAGEYSIQRELGRGGMGIVYLAREVQLDRDVAIKVLPAPLALTPAARERFIREARMAASLSHPHIVPMLDAGETDYPGSPNGAKVLYYVMPVLQGASLRDRLNQQGQLSFDETLQIKHLAGDCHERDRHTFSIATARSLAPPCRPTASSGSGLCGTRAACRQRHSTGFGQD